MEKMIKLGSVNRESIRLTSMKEFCCDKRWGHKDVDIAAVLNPQSDSAD
jgi:hypothetical protein